MSSPPDHAADSAAEGAATRDGIASAHSGTTTEEDVPRLYPDFYDQMRPADDKTSKSRDGAMRADLPPSQSSAATGQPPGSGYGGGGGLTSEADLTKPSPQGPPGTNTDFGGAEVRRLM